MKTQSLYTNLIMTTTSLIACVFVATLMMTGCASRLPAISGIKDISTSDYETFVNDKTKKASVYDGFYNKLTVQATRLDSEMTDNALSYQAKLSQWNEAQFKAEKAKAIEKHATQTEFFISFFTPERKNDNLSSKQTSWKIYLELNGNRYEGTVTKVKTSLTDLVETYPFHNRWSTAYTVTFPVATASSEKQPVVLTLTGPLATTQIQF